MKIGLVGLPLTGKTTFFNLLTNSQAETAAGKMVTNLGTARVPDPRIDFLSKLYQPRKTIYAQIDVVDLAGLMISGEQQKSSAAKFLHDVRSCDALVHVLRTFTNREVVHVAGEINPQRDLETVEMELLFADMELIEKRKARILVGKKIKEAEILELEYLDKCYAFLETGVFIGDSDLSLEERAALKNYAFLTEKPRLAVVNLDEEQFRKKEYPQRQKLMEICQEKGIRLLEICAQMEWEISELSTTDKKLFMEDLGLTETGIELLARHAYEHLGLIPFFTVGEDEVRAWTIAKGTTAKVAAGKIHSDIERGFIRAEVVKFNDLKRLGQMSQVKEKGLFRLEGKNYLVEDGDIINFRFNV